MQRLALDHITAIDTTPVQLTEAARAAGCDGMCLFMEPMDVLPLMPKFEIYDDLAARRDLKARMHDLGVVLDLAYPFTLAGRTEVAGFAKALECAADLGAGLVNVLIYDRDPARRQENFAAFCDLARGQDLRVALEFYPVSQVRSLAEALALVVSVGRPGEVGINADLLHLMRSGGTLEELAAAPSRTILYGQYADGPANRFEAELDFEASSDRLIPGQGSFDIAGFARALPPGCPVSIEVPRNAAVLAGVPVSERVNCAVSSLRALFQPVRNCASSSALSLKAAALTLSVTCSGLEPPKIGIVWLVCDAR